MIIHTSLFHRVLLHPRSVFKQLMSAALAWTMVMSSLPVYAANGQPEPRWVQHGEFNLLSTPASLPNAGTGVPAVSQQPSKPSAIKSPQAPFQASLQPSVNSQPGRMDGTGVAGPKSFEMAKLMAPPLNKLPKPDFMLQSGTPSGTAALAVFVGYADDVRSSPSFPVPWQGSPNTTFIGAGPSFDAGGIRLDNNSDSPIVIDDVFVTVPGWGTRRRPAG